MTSTQKVGRIRKFLWKILFFLFGSPPELKSTIQQLETQNLRLMQLEKELEKVREERLQWMARESSTRKELQDCQQRSKDLLEQVVQLTHQQRETKKSLLDHQFKTSTTPLERNRFEMELSDARAKQNHAEERAKRAEGKIARLRQLEHQVERIKDLEVQLGFEKQRASIQNQALAATLAKLKQLETSTKPKSRRPVRKRRYLKPKIQKKSPSNNRQR